MINSFMSSNEVSYDLVRDRLTIMQKLIIEMKKDLSQFYIKFQRIRRLN
jgi:hypothetical protein